jgi:hypothetical protein
VAPVSGAVYMNRKDPPGATAGIPEAPRRARFMGRSPMRVLAMLALALLLAGCKGDRIKHGSMNERQPQPQSTGLPT